MSKFKFHSGKIIFVFLGLTGLLSCGQSGPLYLPNQKPPITVAKEYDEGQIIEESQEERKIREIREREECRENEE